MLVSIGSDHRGINQRAVIAQTIEACGHQVNDLGTHSTESCDYPDIAALVARSVGEKNSDRGILVCGTGIGVSIAANKVDGVRAALCYDLPSARLSRSHNDANVLCLPADSLSADQMKEMLTVWLNTEFEGGRHARRVEKIHQLENRCQ